METTATTAPSTPTAISKIITTTFVDEEENGVDVGVDGIMTTNDDNNSPAYLDDLHVIQSVCSSSYWDDLAEDYVDEAGRCLEAIVSTPPTLALHEVTVDTIGVVGIQVNRPKCRDYTELAVSPSPPADMRLVVSFLRHGEVFATTPLSQPLRTAVQLPPQRHHHGANSSATTATSGEEDPSIVSDDVSSLEASFMDFSANHHQRQQQQQFKTRQGRSVRPIVGAWGRTAHDGRRERVTFDSCIEISADGEETSDIDVVLYLVDTTHGPQNHSESTQGVDGASPQHSQQEALNASSSPSLASVPIAIGTLRIQGNGSEKCMVCDIPLHEPFVGQILPTLYVTSPKLEQQEASQPQATASMPSSKKKKKARGLAKLFKSSRHKKTTDNADEEKKDDEDDETTSFSLSINTPSSLLINEVYTLDQIQGAFLRFNVEWKEKEINFEVNLQDSSLAENALVKKNSIEENTTLSQDDPTTIQEESILRQGPGQPTEALGPTRKKLPTNKKENGKPPLAELSSKSKSTLSSQSPPKPKKHKSMSFFFKKKKSEKEVVTLPEPPVISANNRTRSTGGGVSMMPQQEPEERCVKPEPDQEGKNAAIRFELRDGSLPTSGTREFGTNPEDSESDAFKSEDGDLDDETTHSMFDSMFKAMVGQSKAEVVLQELGAETTSTTAKEEYVEPDENDDETAHSIFDSMFKAMVGGSETEVVLNQSDIETRSVANESLTSKSTSRSGKIAGNIVPTGTAYCHVMPPEAPAQALDNKSTTETTIKSENEKKPESYEDIQVVASDNNSQPGFEMTSDSGLYAQFVQATNSLLGRVEGYPHVELKQLETCASVSNEPKQAVEMSLSDDTNSCKESELVKRPDMEQAPRRSSGPVDIDAVDDGEVLLSDEDESLSPQKPGSIPVRNEQKRPSTPSPADLSLERILSWDERRVLEGRKGPRFAFGRRNRALSVGESVKNTPSHSPKSKKKQAIATSLAPKLDTGLACPSLAAVANEKNNQNKPVEGEKKENSPGKPPSLPIYNAPLSKKAPLKPPSSLPRHPRQSSKFNKIDRGTQKLMDDEPSTPPRTTSPKRKFKWGKLFKSRSSSSLVNPSDLKMSVEAKSTVPIARSSASVMSDAETVEIDNMAKASVIEALGENDRPASPIPISDRAMSRCRSDDSAFVSQEEELALPQPAKPGFSLFDMFGKTEAACGPVNVDGKEAWLYARDDETYVTKESQTTNRQTSSQDDELTLIPSPTDVLLSETYHRCGPARIADLGDAVMEEARHFFRNKSDSETLATFTFDEPTIDPSVLSGDGKSASVTSKARTVGSTPSRPPKRSGNPPSITQFPLPDKHSPKGVVEFDRSHERSKMESFSEAFMNFVTCRPSGRNPLDGTVPSEFIRRNDTDSVGDDLTLTTYEMQVEIEQYKKKIEQVRHQAECLDVNGDEVGEDAALTFQSPNVVRQAKNPSPSFEA